MTFDEAASIFMKFDNLRADVGRWGWMRSLFLRVMSRLRTHVGVHIYRVGLRPLVRNPPEPNLGGITMRILQPEELLQAANDPELDMRPAFVRTALARGDIAFGAFEAERLVGYAWRTFRVLLR